ncbi:MAG TPA: hypothetical protein EYH20_02220, partial [Leucothrix sp.]|nr:hypothetical protein [Leucothrix sp.]
MANKETEYYSETEIINSTRALTVSIVLLFLSFTLIDFWSDSSTLPEVFITGSLVVSCLLISYLTTFIPKLYRYINIVVPSVILISSIAIMYMIYKASPSDRTYSVYFVSLVLMIMTLYSWTYIKFSSSLVISYAIVAGYVYIERYTRPVDITLSTAEILANVSIIAS